LYFYEFKESKYLNGVQNFLLNYSSIWVVKTFKQKVLSLKKVYSKGFSSLNLHLKKKVLQKFMKYLSNWIQILTTIHFPFLYFHYGISVPRNDHWAKKLSSLSSSPLITNPLSISHFLLGLLHLSYHPIICPSSIHQYTNSSLLPVHLRQATQLALKVQNISTHILVWKWFLAHKSFMNFHQ
jgi:hypothetical protein